MSTAGTGSDAWFYLLAAVCGVGAGWADVAVDDLLFTALLVLASCMLLDCCGRAGRGAGCWWSVS